MKGLSGFEEKNVLGNRNLTILFDSYEVEYGTVSAISKYFVFWSKVRGS